MARFSAAPRILAGLTLMAGKVFPLPRPTSGAAGCARPVHFVAAQCDERTDGETTVHSHNHVQSRRGRLRALSKLN